MGRYLPLVFVLAFAHVASAQPGLAIRKDSTLNGTGSAGSPLGLSTSVTFPGKVGGAITQAGYGGIGVTRNNFSFGGKSFVQLQCGDNEGTRYTGFDATGYNVGDVVWLFNTNGLEDASSCILRPENGGSSANNQIVTPDDLDFKIGGENQGVMLIRAPILDGAGNPTASIRWFVNDITDHIHTETQWLGIYPSLEVGITTPLTGTLNNWRPTGEFPVGYAWGLDGSDGAWEHHSSIRVGTAIGGATIRGLYWDDLDGSDLGPVKFIMNYGPGPLTFNYQDPVATAAYRITTPCGDALTLQPGESVIFHKPSMSSTWMTLATSAPSRVCASRLTVTATDPTNDAATIAMAASQQNGLHVVNDKTGQTPTGNVARYVWVEGTGSYNATTATQTAFMLGGRCATSKSAGANTNDCNAVYGDCSSHSGGICRAGYFIGQVRIEVGFPFVAGGTSDLVGNVQTYATTNIGDDTTDTSYTFGHRNLKGTAPIPSSCGSGPTLTGTDAKGTFTTGTGATACTIPFSRTYTQNAMTCTVTARTGSQQASTTYSTSATALTLSAAPASATYDYDCACIGAGCT